MNCMDFVSSQKTHIYPQKLLYNKVLVHQDTLINKMPVKSGLVKIISIKKYNHIMESDTYTAHLRQYFLEKLEKFGATAQGADWNSEIAQKTRFEQLVKIINNDQPYSIIDYGSGCGALLDYLTQLGHKVNYFGFDLVEEIIIQGTITHQHYPFCQFTSAEKELPVCDYAVASGIFNIKNDISHEQWTQYVVNVLEKMNNLAQKGFSFNMLTKYSDPDHMRPGLYYGDPCFYFDHCKKHFSRNVAVLHDYNLYDFTVLVRKEL